MKKIIAFHIAVGLVVSTASAYAMPNFLSMELTTPGTSRTLVLPAAAGGSPALPASRAFR